MIKNHKTLFIVPDGVGIRNYLYSDIIKNIKEKSNIILWSTIAKEAFSDTLNLHGINAEYEYLKLEKESIICKLLNDSSRYARLISNSKLVNNKTIISNWNISNNNFKQYLSKKITELIGIWASKKYSRILWLEKQSINNLPRLLVNNYKKKLLELNPKTLFITHQRVNSLMPICIAAKELNIKVITTIYSWDNLPKAKLAVYADYYHVWSAHMKDEMQLYYPEIAANKVVITGTPQFEFYTQEDRKVSKTAFAQKYNLDSSKKWICFSGDDLFTSPYDDQYLFDIAEAISKIEIDQRPQLIFRKSPADDSNRYQKTLKHYSNIIVAIDPIWQNLAHGWGLNFAKIEDIDLLVNLSSHCELVINLGSTMALDFAFFDKPCLYLNYSPVLNQKWNVESIYKFQHFKSMLNLDAVVWINNKEEIIDKIMYSLKNPSKVAVDRKKWTEKIIMHPVENSSRLIAENILL